MANWCDVVRAVKWGATRTRRKACESGRARREKSPPRRPNGGQEPAGSRGGTIPRRDGLVQSQGEGRRSSSVGPDTSARGPLQVPLRGTLARDGTCVALSDRYPVSCSVNGFWILPCSRIFPGDHSDEWKTCEDLVTILDFFFPQVECFIRTRSPVRFACLCFCARPHLFALLESLIASQGASSIRRTLSQPAPTYAPFPPPALAQTLRHHIARGHHPDPTCSLPPRPVTHRALSSLRYSPRRLTLADLTLSPPSTPKSPPPWQARRPSLQRRRPTAARNTTRRR